LKGEVETVSENFDRNWNAIGVYFAEVFSLFGETLGGLKTHALEQGGTVAFSEAPGIGRMTLAAITASIPPINVSQARAAKTAIDVSPLIAKVTISVKAYAAQAMS
jgi:hypothetical protein